MPKLFDTRISQATRFYETLYSSFVYLQIFSLLDIQADVIVDIKLETT